MGEPAPSSACDLDHESHATIFRARAVPNWIRARQWPVDRSHRVRRRNQARHRQARGRHPQAGLCHRHGGRLAARQARPAFATRALAWTSSIGSWSRAATRPIATSCPRRWSTSSATPTTASGPSGRSKGRRSARRPKQLSPKRHSRHGLRGRRAVVSPTRRPRRARRPARPGRRRSSFQPASGTSSRRDRIDAVNASDGDVPADRHARAHQAQGGRHVQRGLPELLRQADSGQRVPRPTSPPTRSSTTAATPGQQPAKSRPSESSAATSSATRRPARTGPWLLGMTLDPAIVSEAWCHQRGYVCMIEEFGERPIKAGEIVLAPPSSSATSTASKKPRRSTTPTVAIRDSTVDANGWKLTK